MSTEKNIFETLFEETPDAYFLIEDGVFIDCNKAAAEMLGASSKDEVLSLHPSEISSEFQPDGRHSVEKADEMMQVALDKGSNRFEWMYQRVDGTNLLVEVLLTSISVGERTIIHTASRDITERKETEKEIQANEERFRSVVEYSQSGILILDNAYKFIYVNDELCKITGYERDELIGMDFREVLTEESKQLVADFYVRRQKGEDVPSRYEFTIKRKDGEIRDCEISSTAFKDSEGNARSVGQLMDITERKISEKHIRESQERFQGMVETINEWVWEIDPTGKYTYVSPRVKDLLGYEPEEVLGKTPIDLMPKEEAERVGGTFGELISKQLPLENLENTNRHKDGRLLVLETSGVPIYDNKGNFAGYRGTDRDITEQKEAEKEIRESQERFQTVADYAYDWEYWLGTDGKFVYISPSCERISGYHAEEFMEKAELFTEIVSAKDKEAWEEHVRLYHGEHSEDVAEINLRINTKEGNERWIGHICQAVHDEEDEWIGRRASNRDITEQKELERQIQEEFERRGKQVELSTEISQKISQATELSDLLEQVVTLTKENLGYYHTQVLRYDALQDAVILLKGYGEVGEKMLAGGHAMPMGVGLIGTAAETGETILRPDLADDPDWHPNPILSDTKGEIAVPIKLGEDILGVLDVQSDTANALTEDDQLLLEGLCGQIAVAMEQTRLKEDMNEQLQEVMRLSRSMSREGWRRYREATKFGSSFVYDKKEVRPMADIGLAEELFANVPMALPGGEILGQIGVADDPENPLSEDDKLLLAQVSEQVALALESARLFEETQSALSEVQQLGSAVEQSVDGMAIADMEGNVQFVNRAWAEMHGYKTEELQGVPLAMFHTEEQLENEVNPFNIKVQEEGQNQGEVGHKRKDGSTFPTWMTVTVMMSDVGTPIALVASAQDITERKKAEEAIAKRAAELATVAKVSTVVATLQDPDQIIQTVADLAKENFDLYHAHIYTLDAAEETLALAAGAGEVGAQMVSESWQIPLDAEQSLVAQAARSREGIIVNDVRATSGFMPNPLLPNTASELAVPLVVGDEILGVLDVQSDEVNHFTDEDVSIQTTLASQVAVALQNARSYQQAQQQAEHESMINIISQRIQSTTSIEDALQVTIRELGRALGAKQTSVQLGVAPKDQS